MAIHEADKLQLLEHLCRELGAADTEPEIYHLAVIQARRLVPAERSVLVLGADDSWHLAAAAGCALDCEPSMTWQRALHCIAELLDNTTLLAPIAFADGRYGVLAADRMSRTPDGEARWLLSTLASLVASHCARLPRSGRGGLASDDHSALIENALRVLNHDTRAGLNAIVLTLETLRNELFGPLNPQQRDSIAQLSHKCRDIARLVEERMDQVRDLLAQ